MRAGARARLIGGALICLCAGWALAPAGVPLYDGIGFPDEPYRYVSPPPGSAATKPAGVATATVALADGTDRQGFQVTSGEGGPQVSIYVPAGALHAAGTAASVTVTATPQAPPAGADAPGDGTITGNVYRVGAQAGPAPATLSRGTAGSITLRAPTGFAVVPVMEFRSGGGAGWGDVHASRQGNDIFEAPFAALGDYAMVLPAHGRSATSGGAGRTLIIVLAVVAGVAALTILVIRGMRTIALGPGEGDGFDEESDDHNGSDEDAGSQGVVGPAGHDGGHDVDGPR